MAIIEGWLPPTRAHYDLILRAWQLAFPPLASIQWLVRWYPMGKTSVASRLNLPGRAAWMTMEAPGFLTLLYLMSTMPARHGVEDLPWQNRVLGGLFVIHYSYRAIAYPLLQPSMAPIHVFVWAAALCFQLINATCLGSWLSAYGPLTADAWAAQSPLPQFALGMLLFYVGLAGNFFHDEELREIRRRAAARQTNNKNNKNTAGPSSKANGSGGSSSSNGTSATSAHHHHYEIPQAGLFRYMLYPHYFCEWVEWLGFLMAAGWTCAPAWAFLVNEVASMLPRAVSGKRWYVERFGADKVGKKWAIIPGLL
ncbi:hypothetical protein JDV02_010455 [Purpureocillium takamizusanense]|uniref:3-oxo-5-alpha-steroid 4-dehydrogenase C-terminal domain-containing protein n=1 Tax=Purpureocillium takamizusanense TaxID=2060973 RepID=A0A9Q8QRU7_9HYPO|nr:uncharacterized protein JDV02_010455 [Purpureocillium takamizusanense]UNI24730.1 hypothetical protein JDV02_010455 [Purpureocillium takamizusanense]